MDSHSRSAVSGGVTIGKTPRHVQPGPSKTAFCSARRSLHGASARDFSARPSARLPSGRKRLSLSYKQPLGKDAKERILFLVFSLLTIKLHPNHLVGALDSAARRASHAALPSGTPVLHAVRRAD